MTYIIKNIDTDEIYQLDDGLNMVGRGPRCDIHIDEKHVSRHHADIESDGDEVVIVDHGSTNGTFVNDEKVLQKTPLKPKDKIRFGKTIFEFSIKHIDRTSERCKNGLFKLFKKQH